MAGGGRGVCHKCEREITLALIKRGQTLDSVVPRKRGTSVFTRGRCVLFPRIRVVHAGSSSNDRKELR